MSMDRLREFVDAATECETYQGPWSYRWVADERSAWGGEWCVGSDSEMGHIADVIPWAEELAAFIATFDPQVVGALLDVAEAANEIVSPSYLDAPEPYAQGVRLDEMRALMAALDALSEVTP